MPTLSINDVTVSESAGSARFAVSLSEPGASAVAVMVSTTSGTAQAGADFSALADTLGLAAGVTSGQVSVPMVATVDRSSTIPGQRNLGQRAALPYPPVDF